MKIGIGLICKDAIIVASDSQTTRGAVKDLHAQKISIVDFADGRIVIAQAGVADLSEGTIRTISQKAACKTLTPVMVKDIVVESIREVRRHFWDLDHLERLSDEQVRAYYDQKDFTLLIGFYHERKPHLFTVDLSWCYPVEVRRHHTTIGIGAYLADYLISEYLPNKVEFSDGYPLAIYAVEKVIDNVDGCGHPTWAGFTFPVPEVEINLRKEAISKGKTNRRLFYSDAVILSRQEVDLVVSELKQAEALTRERQIEYIREIMRNVSKKRLADMVPRANDAAL